MCALEFFIIINVAFKFKLVFDELLKSFKTLWIFLHKAPSPINFYPKYSFRSSKYRIFYFTQKITTQKYLQNVCRIFILNINQAKNYRVTVRSGKVSEMALKENLLIYWWVRSDASTLFKRIPGNYVSWEILFPGSDELPVIFLLSVNINFRKVFAISVFCEKVPWYALPGYKYFHKAFEKKYWK